MDTSPAVLQYEMGYTESEFEKVLKGTFTGPSSIYRCKDNGCLSWLIRHVSQALEITINIRQGQPRQLGIMQLPVLHVQFSLTSASPPLQAEFFDRFFKYFHKGGG